MPLERRSLTAFLAAASAFLVASPAASGSVIPPESTSERISSGSSRRARRLAMWDWLRPICSPRLRWV
jgi:hypothetical protein